MEIAINFVLVQVSVYKQVSGVNQDTFLILLKEGNFFLSPRHEGIKGSRFIAPLILNLGTIWRWVW
jgi:hypothetical protein